MFNWLARPNKASAGQSDLFQARSLERDAATDRERTKSIMEAIEAALQGAEHEFAGLKVRIDDVLARAAVTVGSAADEYLEREPHRSYHQNLFDAEIMNGQRRLDELAKLIGHLKFLRAAALSRFTDFEPHRQS